LKAHTAPQLTHPPSSFKRTTKNSELLTLKTAVSAKVIRDTIDNACFCAQSRRNNPKCPAEQVPRTTSRAHCSSVKTRTPRPRCPNCEMAGNETGIDGFKGRTQVPCAPLSQVLPMGDPSGTIATRDRGTCSRNRSLVQEKLTLSIPQNRSSNIAAGDTPISADAELHGRTKESLPPQFGRHITTESTIRALSCGLRRSSQFQQIGPERLFMAFVQRQNNIDTKSSVNREIETEI
jgi:hypothetical protein